MLQCDRKKKEKEKGKKGMETTCARSDNGITTTTNTLPLLQVPGDVKIICLSHKSLRRPWLRPRRRTIQNVRKKKISCLVFIVRHLNPLCPSDCYVREHTNVYYVYYIILYTCYIISRVRLFVCDRRE